ncbi:MAG: porin family protein [Sulfurovum sp.]|nr:porin family protein [Sulfurovum sp.]
MKNIGLSLLSVIVSGNIVFAGANTTRTVDPIVEIPLIVDESVSGFYLGLGVSAVSTHEEDLDFFSITEGQDRTGDISLALGYDWNEYIGLEARYMVSIAKEDIVDRSSWGIYVKPQYPITEDFKIYGLIGIGGFDASGTNHFGQNISADDVSLQWGLGVSYQVYENISLYIDYIQVASDVSATAFVNKNVDVSSDAINIGISYHF